MNASKSGVNTPQLTLPTAQMPSFVAYEKSVAQAGGTYAMYIPSGGTVPSKYACPSDAPSAGCVVFLDGPLTMAGSTTATRSH